MPFQARVPMLRGIIAASSLDELCGDIIAQAMAQDYIKFLCWPVVPLLRLLHQSPPFR